MRENDATGGGGCWMKGRRVEKKKSVTLQRWKEGWGGGVEGGEMNLSLSLASHRPPNAPSAGRKSFAIKRRKRLQKHKSRTIAGRKCKKHGKKDPRTRPDYPQETLCVFYSAVLHQ